MHHFPWIQRPVEGHFLERLNRFAGRVSIEGHGTRVHLPNSGRLEELLTPGACVLLEERRRTGKTRHDLLLAQSRRYPEGDPIWVGLDSRLPTKLLRWCLEERLEDWVGEIEEIRREPRLGNHRFDLRVRSESGLHYIETKSVNLLDTAGVARFPDAPTIRGRRQLEALTGLGSGGVYGWLFFVILRADARAFSPFVERDPAFAEALSRAVRSGVGVRAVQFAAGTALRYLGELDLCMPAKPFPGFWPQDASL